MSAPDLALLQPVLSELAPQGRTALLPALHAAQDLYGYIPEPVAEEIARTLRIPLADVFGVLEFYALFHTEPVGKVIIHVCNDPACALAGADTVLKQLSRHAEYALETGELVSVTIEEAPCLGLCDHAPALLIQNTPATASPESTWQELVAKTGRRPHTHVDGDLRLLTKRCGSGQTTSLEAYLADGGYTALKKALAMSSTSVIEEIKASGLVGRGGAAFPTGLKWESAAQAQGSPKYVVCNADEAEPGTFKDRVLMEDDPHQILEGMIIAAYAIGAEKGYFYIRGEYLNAYHTIQRAVEEARTANLLGAHILGSDFSFDIEIRRGAGAYICGEETALFESIEGKRGFPRVKPPFPTTHGLFGKPTVINNVETLANVPLILNLGAKEYHKIGTEKSPGPKLFCLSGDVHQPGLYEVPFGVTLRHLIFDLGGGLRSDVPFQAALIGGAAGTFATSDHLDTPLSFEGLRSAGLTLGSGVITVFDAQRDLRDVLYRLARFFAEESCGKCYPCQIGTQRQYEILARLRNGQFLPGDIERLQDVGWTMTDASLCGLGQTAASAILSALKYWPHLFQPAQPA
ncbi:MAG: NADH-quinone oxidoreductase subunit NuoF [Thermanaerothrix sp.]|uniref:NADH-quinone oxidoreductase subunit NuoF n=1 Tax=Thermanaerothrix sp. TaxID=2972675 RepID=UPI003C7CD585